MFSSLAASTKSRCAVFVFDPGYNADKGDVIVITEDDVLAALDRPLAVYALQQRLDPSSKSTDALQDQLMRMRASGKLKFDIKTGKWAKN